MSFSQMTLPEFDMEMASTRKCLERVPDDKLDWQPHEKSMSFASLAGHIADIPTWVGMTLKADSFDLAPPDSEPWKSYVATSQEELLSTFDKNVADARQALAEADGVDMGGLWSLLSGDVTHFTMPRAAVLRSMVLNHLYHHRGQLTVYLRLNGIPLPGIYGPSADEA